MKGGREPVTGIILAGGKGIRFGGCKCFIKIGNNYLIENSISVFTDIFDEIIISTNTPSSFEFIGNHEIKIVKDILSEKGPLIGIYSALKESSNELNFVSACDMPFKRHGLIEFMLKKSIGYDVIIPALDADKLEPLHALYKKSCIPFMEQVINEGKRRIISFFPYVKVYKMKKEEIIPYDKELISFFNINTKHDLIRAKTLLKNQIGH